MIGRNCALGGKVVSGLQQSLHLKPVRNSLKIVSTVPSFIAKQPSLHDGLLTALFVAFMVRVSETQINTDASYRYYFYVITAERIDKATKLMMKKTDGPAPTKERKKTLKAHKKKLKKPSSEGPTNMIPQEIVALPSSLPMDNISDNNDDNFWDFYDKPFNKPT